MGAPGSTEKRVKVVITTPVTHADVVRRAIGDAGGGILGNYTHCSFSSRGLGRFRPQAGARPSIGAVGRDEQVEEERIEVTVDREHLPAVVQAIRDAHPYEEIPLDVYPLEDPSAL